MEILKKTLDQMPTNFSSNEFMKVARKNGVNDYAINSGALHNFLLSNCKKEGRRVWRKFDLHTNIVEDKIQIAIDLLKANGYKVLKEVNQWKEI